jgi:hypothetical protein
VKKVGPKELGQMLEHAKSHLIQLPTQVRLMNMGRPLSDGERMALCYLEAALTVLGGMGVDTSEVAVAYDDSVHEAV